MPVRRWITAQGDKERSREIAERFGIPRFAAHLLVTRGFTEDSDIETMLNPAARPLSDPLGYADMDKAVARINTAIDAFEAIAVYGDYDVDGVTSTALLYSYLTSREANVTYMLPSRDEDGYGLNRNVIDRMHALGVRLIITVDNGISALAEIDYANSLGVDVVVTDHHRPSELLPAACAVVDPHRADCTGGFDGFAGVGVAFKLVCALDGDCERVLGQYADLVALGTVADVVPLVGENRTLVVRGLELMKKGCGTGLEMLMAVSGVDNKRVGSSDLAYVLAPRINSAGRVGNPDKAVRLLLTDDEAQARELSEELQSENSQRHELERTIAEDAWRLLRKEPEVLNQRVVVVCGQDWNSGVLGIFAARLCEQLGKPCIILSSDGETAHGSGRCFGEFSLFEALTDCADLLETYGGHKSAAGLTIKTSNVAAFRERINDFARRFGDMPVPTLEIDCDLPPCMLDLSLVGDAARLEPFGACNPAPLVSVCGAIVRDVVPVGGGKHHRLVFEKDGRTFTAMYFNLSKECFAYYIGDRVDVAFSMGVNTFRGQSSLNLIIKDMRLHGTDIDAINEGEELFDRLTLEQPLTADEAERLLPDRPACGAVYRYLRSGGYHGSIDILAARLQNQLTYARLRTALAALTQCGLLSVSRKGGMYTITVLECDGKARLEDAEIMCRLSDCIIQSK